MEIGYYFIITNGNQFDGHWLYKDIGFCLCSMREFYIIYHQWRVCRLKWLKEIDWVKGE